jgi:hypothetical protein
VPVGVTGHRTQRPRGQVGPPGPHPAQPSSSLDPGGERWPIFRPLAPLIAQLVNPVSLRAPNRPLSGSMAFLGHLGLNTVQKSKGKAKNPLNGARQ